MKRLLFTLLTDFLAASGLAQERKGFIGRGLGPTLPLADFSRRSSESGSGFAKPGIAADVSAGYQFSPVAGAMLLFKSQLNGHNTDGFFEEEAESNGWLTRAILAGPYLVGKPLSEPRVEGAGWLLQNQNSGGNLP